MKGKKMAKPSLYLLSVLLAGFLIFSCGDDDTTGPENQAPSSISNPVPANNATDVSVTPTLTWECTDPDGDQLTYDVYLGTDNNSLDIVSNDQSELSYTPATLEYETTYYWKIVVTDDKGGSLEGDISGFTTGAEINVVPGAPSNPDPENNSIDVSLTPTLTWECTDTDGDPLTYDIYFGTNDNLELISQSQSSTIYALNDSLEYETAYYWQVIVSDDHSNQTTGDIWLFTTIPNTNQAPGVPSLISPNNNAEDVTPVPILTWQCSDPEDDPLTYDIYFGTNTENLELISEGQSDSTYELDSLKFNYTYYWQIAAIDDHGNQTLSDIGTFRIFALADIKWCDVGAGVYTYGQNDSTAKIDYDYSIMIYEVTNWQYVHFLNELLANDEIYFDNGLYESYSVFGYYSDGNEYYPSGYYEFIRWLHDGKSIEWDGERFTIPEGKENHPISNITWFGAWAFADQYGWRLPDRYEWEKAARGNTGWDYAFGDVAEDGRANYYSNGDPFDDEESHNSTPVGYFNGENHDGFQTIDSPSPYGAYDMSGNVWEYTNSWELLDETSYFCYSYGKCYINYPPYFYVWENNILPPYLGTDNIGFRCVRDNN